MVAQRAPGGGQGMPSSTAEQELRRRPVNDAVLVDESDSSNVRHLPTPHLPTPHCAAHPALQLLSPRTAATVYSLEPQTRRKVMTFVDSIRTCFTKYADFKGCASRSEFWWWALFTVVATVSLGVISDKLSIAFTLATLLPYFAVTARRLHDTDRSGWLQLVGLIPIVGWIILIVWCVQEGKSSTRYALQHAAQA